MNIVIYSSCIRHLIYILLYDSYIHDHQHIVFIYHYASIIYHNILVTVLLNNTIVIMCLWIFFTSGDLNGCHGVVISLSRLAFRDFHLNPIGSIPFAFLMSLFMYMTNHKDVNTPRQQLVKFNTGNC